MTNIIKYLKNSKREKEYWKNKSINYLYEL